MRKPLDLVAPVRTLLQREVAMRCDVCGNDYDKPLEIDYLGEHHVFDCFECAVMALAPTCASCGTKVMGHGMEVGGEIYCSAHCARRAGHGELRDRA